MIALLAVLAQVQAPCGSSPSHPCWTAQTTPKVWRGDGTSYIAPPPRRIYVSDAGSYIEDLSAAEVRELMRPTQTGVIIEGNSVVDGTITVTQAITQAGPQVDSGATCEIRCSKDGRVRLFESRDSCGNECSVIDRENWRLRDRLQAADNDHQLGIAGLVMVGLGFLTVAVVAILSRLDRIVGAWRRSEFSRVPWTPIFKWGVFCLASVLGNILGHWLMVSP